MTHCPYAPKTDTTVYTHERGSGRWVKMALLLLDLLRSDSDAQRLTEAVATGAWQGVCWFSLLDPTVGAAVWEAKFLDVVKEWVQRFNPMERVLRSNFTRGTAAALFALTDVARSAQTAGIEVIQPLLDAGAIDIAISTLVAYRMLDDPGAVNVGVPQYGGLQTLSVLLESSQSKEIMDKLRSAGVDAFRYILDHPLVSIRCLGNESTNQATSIAAMVWGRDDEAGSGLTFTQRDIDSIVERLDHNGAFVKFMAMDATFGQALLHLSVSDINKQLLLQSENLLPVMISSLLLDPDHPRRSQSNFDEVAPSVQRDFAEVFAQLVMFEPWQEVLRQDPAVAEALQQVVREGMTDEARLSAESALVPLQNRQPEPEDKERARFSQKHLMLSCASTVLLQCFVPRCNSSLIAA